MADDNRGVLLVKTRHGNAYYVFVTKEERDLAFVRLLRDNWQDGYYNPPEKPHEILAKDKFHLDMSDEEFAELPQAVQDAMIDDRTKIRSHFTSQERRYAADVEMWETIQRIVSAPTAEDAARDYRTPNGEMTLAEQIISARSGYEHEGFEIGYDCNQDES